jgi:NAD(P)-dependent dehydrogenase (short-subunit alcohol dehydrogenase family)
MTGAPRSILLIGTSRGLGKGLAEAYVKAGWSVVATVRDAKGVELPGGEVEPVDIDRPETVDALHAATEGRRFDVIFIVAGAGVNYAPIHKTPIEESLSLYRTNAISPVLFAEQFLDRLAPGGQMVFMTSMMGSIAGNTVGSADAYRASKSALNMLVKSFSLRHRDAGLAITLMHPGWVRTDMGGANAAIDVDTSVAGMMKVLADRAGKGDLAYVDYTGAAWPW